MFAIRLWSGDESASFACECRGIFSPLLRGLIRLNMMGEAFTIKTTLSALIQPQNPRRNRSRGISWKTENLIMKYFVNSEKL